MMVDMPSVAMKAGILPLTMTTPLTLPSSMQERTMTMKAARMPKPLPPQRLSR